MSETVDASSWELLIRDLNEATAALNSKNPQGIEKGLSAFGRRVTQLGLTDMRELAVKFARFYSKSVLPSWDEEAIATLSFSLGALVEKMQMAPYGEKFSSGLREIHEFLDVLEEGAEEESPPPPGAMEPPEALEPPPAAQAEPDTIGPEDQALPKDDEGPRVPPGNGQAPEPLHPDSAGGPLRVGDFPLPGAAAVPQVEAVSEFHLVEKEAALNESLECPSDLYAHMLRLDPCSRVFVNLAESLCSEERWSEAAEVCRRGLKGHPHSVRARLLLGRALLKMGCMDEAEFVLQKGRIELERNAGIYRLLAEISRTKGDVDGAEKFMDIHAALQQVEAAAGGTAAKARRREGEPPDLSGLEGMATLMGNLLKRFEDKGAPPSTPLKLFEDEARYRLRRILEKAPN